MAAQTRPADRVLAEQLRIIEHAYEQTLGDNLGEIDGKVPEYLKDIERIYIPFGESDAFHAKVRGWLNHVRGMAYQGINAPREIHDLSPILHDLRLIKTDDDLRGLRRACEISAEAHKIGMRCTRPGKYEYEVQAEIEYIFRTQGSMRNGYPSSKAASAP